MFDALSPWMPQFNGEGLTFQYIPAPNNGTLRMVRPAGDYVPPRLAG